MAKSQKPIDVGQHGECSTWAIDESIMDDAHIVGLLRIGGVVRLVVKIGNATFHMDPQDVVSGIRSNEGFRSYIHAVETR